MDTLLAYANGNWIPSHQLAVGVTDRGFLLGATLTERLRTFRGQVFRLDEHLARLRQSLEVVGLRPGIAEEIAEVVPAFVEKNRSQIEPHDDWTVIVFVTPGVAGSDCPTVCVHGWPLLFHSWAGYYEHGMPVVVSDVRQVPDNCWPSELKCRSRMHYYLADMRAAARKPGARAILLDQEGYVAESTTANVIIYREGEGLSSPPEDHILVGVSLGVVRELAGQLGIPFMQRRLTVEDLRTADEVMLTSTSVCLLPVVECDGQPIGACAPGPTFQQLLQAWSDMVGVDIAEQARRFSSRR